MLTFTEYCEINDEELYILAAETGAYLEPEYDAEEFAWEQYEEYLKAQELMDYKEYREAVQDPDADTDEDIPF